ncbi:MAG TPA: ATP-binding protein [Anaerolineales bacterium]|nr:ATP-binding protein [Anaerolineales bacterium]
MQDQSDRPGSRTRLGGPEDTQDLKTVLRRRIQENEAIAAINRALSETLDLQEVLQLIVDSARKVIPGVERAVIHLLSEGDELLFSAAVSGFEKVGRAGIGLRPGEGVAGRVLAMGVTINVRDTHADSRYLLLDSVSGLRSLLVAPLQTRQRRLGTISVQGEAPGLFSHDDERLLTSLGLQAALAIENARLLADTQKALRREQATRAQLVQTEKLSAMGRLTASVAHELNNPLQAIQGALFLIRQEQGLSEQGLKDLDVILTEVERMAKLINLLRETYQPPTREELTPESLNRLVEEVRALIENHLNRNRVTFEFMPDQALPNIPLNRDQIKQVLLNLCLNALEAMPEGGQLSLTTRADPESGGAWLTVQDTGIGIPPEDIPNIFDPFFTTKKGGSGLGLSICFDIIQRHGGRIMAESDSTAATMLRVWLPVEAPYG